MLRGASFMCATDTRFAGLSGLVLTCGALGLVTTSGCSLVLDFDQQVDAMPIDGPVSVEQCATNEPNDLPGTATAWAGVDISGAICGNGDVDLYAVALVDNQPITATITFMNRGGAGDLDLRLLTANGGSVLDDSKTSGDSETVMCPGGTPCPPITNGTYLLEVKGFTPAVESAYTLHIDTGGSTVDAGVDAPIDAATM